MAWLMTREQLDQLLSKAPPPQQNPKLEALSDRELELYSMMSQHYPGSQICEELGVTRDELVVRKAELQKKLGLKDQVQLVQFIAKNQPSA
ncbi:MAG TPA: LuxR C-terminal-related transcriptional regulator [Methylomirabilota bacterium]|nr:LuxR C-terminal-related transcriptional regulator [Methylomirabilota bacterium]